jgi:hypothetical protein
MQLSGPSINRPTDYGSQLLLHTQLFRKEGANVRAEAKDFRGESIGARERERVKGIGGELVLRVLLVFDACRLGKGHAPVAIRLEET